LVSKSTIEKCKKGERLAYKEIYEKCIAYVYSVVSRYLNVEEDRKDTIQEIFAKVFSNIAQFDETKGVFKFWLRKITVNECLMHLRRQTKIKVHSINEDFDIIDTQNSKIESLTREDIMNLLKDMPQRYKLVFMAYVIDGFNHEEIGLQLGITKDTSRSQLTRSKRWIQKHISKETQNQTYGLF